MNKYGVEKIFGYSGEYSCWKPRLFSGCRAAADDDDAAADDDDNNDDGYSMSASRLRE